MKWSRTLGCAARRSQTACVLCAEGLSRMMWIAYGAERWATTSLRNPTNSLLVWRAVSHRRVEQHPDLSQTSHCGPGFKPRRALALRSVPAKRKATTGGSGGMTPLLRDLGEPRIAPCLWASDAPMCLRDFAVVVVWVRGSGDRSASPLTISLIASIYVVHLLRNYQILTRIDRVRIPQDIAIGVENLCVLIGVAIKLATDFGKSISRSYGIMPLVLSCAY